MAKSKSFFGLRKGSTKTMTYSVLRGQQITKDRVTDIANPRTMDQTLQRIPFAQAVKFYKQATKGLFRFAFEDKRPLESDYNAFMRNNVKYASSVSIDNYRNEMYPAFGNWLLSTGSLGTPALSILFDNVGLVVDTATSAVTTVGGASSLILSKYDYLAEGDIVTFVAFVSSIDENGQIDNDVLPTMKVVQFVIDSTSTATLASVGLENMALEDSALNFAAIDQNYACAGAIIFSRNSPTGLKTSVSYLIGNGIWDTNLNRVATNIAKQGNAYSWGAAEKAILQGSLSD